MTKPVVAEQDPFIVAIGASAGGLEAIHEFFDNMPVNGNLAFVIIQHLSPDYKSLLVELVSRHTHMEVFEAQHNVTVRKHCVYVIPNNKLLTIDQGRLQLSTKLVEKAPNTAIDTFFRSLAIDQGSKAIAVILSGTGTDGTKGAHEIQGAGGLVIVQDPISAKFDGMPNSAIAAGYADYILSPELIPEEIYTYTNEHPVRDALDGRPDERALPEVLQLIETHCGHDFHNYKSPTILRRISKRMGELGKKNFSEYLDLLRNKPEECKILGKEFLIGVTKFFRDTAAFDVLRNEVLPALLQQKGEEDVIKVWVTACSTGQEAYSIAMLVNEFLLASGRTNEIKIFATDMDADAIDLAAKGAYPVSSVQDLDPYLVKKYFTEQAGTVTVVPNLRKQIVFARHNILKDPPFIKNDLVTCRNMLIYMNNILQRRVFSTLEFALHTGGYLFLGPSEIPGSIKSNLEEINSKWKIFRKLKEVNPYQSERFTTGYSIRQERTLKEVVSLRDDHKAKELVQDFQQILISQFGFAAVYVDENYEIKEAVGDFRRYLSLPERIATLNILKMVGTDLSVALNTAIRKARKEQQTVTLQHVKVRNAAGEQFLNIYVKPSEQASLMTIVMGESSGAVFQKPFNFAFQPTESVSHITELEEELKEVKLNLQMAVESLETTNEELQSSNEELLSANEELQSSNEELQSLNEELHTLNTEHQLRIRELIELNDDLNNYFGSTEIGQIFTDKELRIRKFNPAAVPMVNLIDSDIGRPIDHISTNIKNYNLTESVRQVIATKELVEREVVLANGRTSIMRILPYIRVDKQTDGAVISFFDITDVKALNTLVKSVFDTSSGSIMVLKALRNEDGTLTDFSWMAANQASHQLLKTDPEKYIGLPIRETFPGLYENGLFEKLVNTVETGTLLQTELVNRLSGKEEWYEVQANKMGDGVVVNLRDISDKKTAEQKLRQNYHELIRVKENLKQLNAGLEQTISERTRNLSESEERFRLIAGATTDAVWDRDLVKNEIWWSESFYSLFGFEAGAVEKNNAFWLSHIHPEDKEAVQKSMLDAINNGAANWTAAYRFRRSDGSYAHIRDRGAVINDEFGIPYRMLGAMSDVSEAEKAEQQLQVKNTELQKLYEEFRFVTDFMPQMVWSTQPDGYHDFYNKGWYDFTGLTYEETKDKGWSLVLHPDDYDRTWKVWSHSLETGEPYEVEYRMRRHDGEYRWFLARALPLTTAEGTILKWFGTCTDIHDQRTIADVLEQKVSERTAELQKINAELEVTNAELFQFASVASHDLKEPLRKIHMFSTLIRDRYLGEEHTAAMDYIRRIINSSARMTKLINDLLTFSRLSIKSFFEATDLNTVVEEVLSDLELPITEKEAQIEVAHLPVIDAVPGQLRQVFQNLIGNALKFTRPGETPKIRIDCEMVTDGFIGLELNGQGPYCRISISDNGIGFEEQHAAKIFTIFQRLHSREKYEGTGIGLAITKKIVEKHNGTIYATSQPQQGSTFTLILPLRQAAVAVSESSIV